MAYFCKHCGCPIDVDAGQCKDCRKTTEEIFEAELKKELGKYDIAVNRRKRTIWLSISIALCSICLIVSINQFKNIVANDITNNIDNKIVDTDEYFEDNSEVESIINAKQSKNIHTEAEAYRNLENRGLAGNKIETTYSVDGDYYAGYEISKNSSEKHPMYETQYNSNGNQWTVYEINGEIFANAYIINKDSNEVYMLILSETNTITSYDSSSNQFYITVPEEEIVVLKTVDRIDKDTIDKVTKDSNT